MSKRRRRGGRGYKSVFKPSAQGSVFGKESLGQSTFQSLAPGSYASGQPASGMISSSPSALSFEMGAPAEEGPPPFTPIPAPPPAPAPEPMEGAPAPGPPAAPAPSTPPGTSYPNLPAPPTPSVTPYVPPPQMQFPQQPIMSPLIQALSASFSAPPAYTAPYNPVPYY